MTVSADSVLQSKEKREHARSRRRVSWSKLAELHGVSTKTLDRWARDGIIPSAEIINGRKYGDPDAAPRLDVA